MSKNQKPTYTLEQLRELARNYILFNTQMVRAVMDGRKSQTRRVIKICPITWDSPTILEPDNAVRFHYAAGGCQNHSPGAEFINSKYKVGDILWVREPAKVIHYSEAGNYGGSWAEDYAHVQYLADDEVYYHWDEFPEDPKSWLWECKGIPNGCCKSLARTFVKITGVRVERLQSILGSEADCIAEGIEIDTDEALGRKWYRNYQEISQFTTCARTSFMTLWNSTSPKGYKWEDNPWVFVYEFEVVEYTN